MSIVGITKKCPGSGIKFEGKVEIPAGTRRDQFTRSSRKTVRDLGPCPACGSNYAVKKDGTMQAHRYDAGFSIVTAESVRPNFNSVYDYLQTWTPGMPSYSDRDK